MTCIMFASIITAIMVMNLAQGLITGPQINLIMVHRKKKTAKEIEHALNQFANKKKIKKRENKHR